MPTIRITATERLRYSTTVEVTDKELAELRENAKGPMVDASDIGLDSLDADSDGLEDIQICEI